MIEVEVDPTLPAETLQQQYYIQQVGVENRKKEKSEKRIWIMYVYDICVSS